MAVVLAYTSPALGHLYPFCALLNELAARGHHVHVRTLTEGVAVCRRLGFAAESVDARVEALQSDSGRGSVLREVGRTVDVLTRRAVLEVGDLESAVSAVDPDVVLVDANCWGAMSAAEAGDLPWLAFSPFIPYLDAPGLAPFGSGYPPWQGWAGAVRNAGIGMVTSLVFDRPFRRGLAAVRSDLGLAPVHSADELLRRAPAVLVATAKPFEYPQTDWGEAVHLIGPANFDPPWERAPKWLSDIELPVVLVTTSSVPQADSALVQTALRALDSVPVHVVATRPAGFVGFGAGARATVTGYVPHAAILERTVCLVTHGGMGITQKALSRGIPVCAVPFGRDQFEVARRVQVARCGRRLPARQLSVERLRQQVLGAMTMTEGARAVAAGFRAGRGMAYGADVVEALVSRASWRQQDPDHVSLRRTRDCPPMRGSSAIP